jgi:hypothetical protein
MNIEENEENPLQKKWTKQNKSSLKVPKKCP